MIEILVGCLCLMFIINTIVTWVYITNVVCSSTGFGLYCTNNVSPASGPAAPTPAPAPTPGPTTSSYTLEPYSK